MKPTRQSNIALAALPGILGSRIFNIAQSTKGCWSFVEHLLKDISLKVVD